MRHETIVLPPRETLRAEPAVMRGTSVPIVYAPLADPDPLTPWQQEEIFRAAEEVRPAGREVRFVLVLLNRTEDLNANVYYTPDEVEGRLRKGRYMYYGWRGKGEAQAKYVQGHRRRREGWGLRLHRSPRRDAVPPVRWHL